MQVVTLYESNFRSAADTLRQIADEIDKGTYGEIGCAAIALLGDTLHVFGAGVDAEPPSIGMLFSAAHQRLAKSLEQHGKSPDDGSR
ncbi:MAG: hypothetical protein H0T60_10375 [Acidobacteria bacterium]|nr:hypothetical protein [Acidobacteriota bacterium]